MTRHQRRELEYFHNEVCGFIDKVNSSPYIQRVLIFLSFLFLCSLSHAAPLGKIPQVEEGPARVEIEYLTDLWTSPNQNKENAVRLYNLNLKLPVLGTEQWTTSFHADLEGYDIGRPDLTLGKNDIRVGSNLRSQSVGFGVSRHPGDGSWLNYFISYNSSSDEPYLAARDKWVEQSLIYALRSNESYRWIFGANFSQNRGYLNGQIIPLVGVSYRPFPDLSVVVGFPFFHANINIENYLRAQLTLTPVGLNTEFIHQVRDDLSVRLRGGIGTRSYLHHKRIDDQDRFFINSKYIDVSFRRALSVKTHYGLALGYSFDRELYEGQQAFRARGSRTTLGPDLNGGFVMEFFL